MSRRWGCLPPSSSLLFPTRRTRKSSTCNLWPRKIWSCLRRQVCTVVVFDITFPATIEVSHIPAAYYVPYILWNRPILVLLHSWSQQGGTLSQESWPLQGLAVAVNESYTQRATYIRVPSVLGNGWAARRYGRGWLRWDRWLSNKAPVQDSDSVTLFCTQQFWEVTPGFAMLGSKWLATAR